MASVNNSGVEYLNFEAEGSRDFEPVVLDHRQKLSRDGQIRLEVMEALHWDLAIPAQRVTVEVEEGWVVLRGRVRRSYSRHRAEWAARGAQSVVGVTNEIIVEG